MIARMHSEIFSVPDTVAVVVFDPTGEHPEGHVLRGLQIEQARTKGVIFVAATEKHAYSPDPIGGRGYLTMKLGHGLDLAVEHGAGTNRVGGVTLFTTAGRNRISWVAKVAPYMTRIAGRMRGRLTLATRQLGGMVLPTVRNITSPLLDELPNAEQWVGGEAELVVDSALFASLSLVSTVQGAKLLSFSVGQVSEP